jgi:VanZ family protein
MRRTTLWLAAYLVFVVYGSLVPLEYRPIPIDEAWQRFSQAPFLVLGVESRADWIANGVLYLPLGVLATLVFRRALDAPWWAAGVLAWLASITVAAAVEFAQVYFPPRTVSRNDLLAEAIGSGVGALIAPSIGGWLERARAALRARSGKLLVLGLKAYLVLYVAFCFFPYDLLVSGAELRDKLASDGWGWLLAPSNRDALIVLVKLAVEVALSVPIGILLARTWPRISPITALTVGAALGIAIELGQLFIASGVSQGLSAFARAVGVVLGAAVPQRLPDDFPLRLRLVLRRFTGLLLLLYLPLVAGVNALLTGTWHGVTGAAATWNSVRLLPFYYHYYTSEAIAVLSLTSVALMYLPLTLLAWAHRLPRPATVGLVAMAAAAVELCKLFVVGLRPDPTNVLIAGGSCWALLYAIERLESKAPPRRAFPGRSGDSSSSDSRLWMGTLAGAAAIALTLAFPSHRLLLVGLLLAAAVVVWRWPVFAQVGSSVTRPPMPAAAQAHPQSALGSRFAGLVMLALAIASWLNYPSFQAALGIALTAYALLLFARPAAWMLVVPTTIAMLDLAPWSGRTYWDELDIVLCVTLGVLLVRRGASLRLRDVPPGLKVFAMSAVIGALWSLTPAPAVDLDSFASLLSPYAAARMLKSIAWGCLLWMVAVDERRRGNDVLGWLTTGFVVATISLFAFTLWEKQAYSALLEFTTSYRATGPSSAANVGGAYLEAFVVLWMPFALGSLATRGAVGPRVVGAVAAVGAVYVALATVARSAVGAVAAAAGIFAILRALLTRGRAPEQGSSAAGSWMAAAGVCALLATAMLLSGIRDRMNTAGEDWPVRTAHWQRTLDIRPGGFVPWFFGSGPGSFSRLFAESAESERHLPSHSVRGVPGRGSLLQLDGGAGYYVEQVVPFARNERYLLSFSARSPDNEALLIASLCAKWLIYSVACDAVEVRPDKAWKRYVFTLDAGKLGSRGTLGSPAVKLSFADPISRSSVHIDDVMLVDRSGQDVLHNGGFDRGSDHWFFSSDDHLAWHAKNLPLHLWLEYGLVGLVAIIWLTTASLIKTARVASAPRAAAVIAGVIALLLLGIFDSLVDSPRVMLALLLTLAAGWAGSEDDRAG